MLSPAFCAPRRYCFGDTGMASKEEQRAAAQTLLDKALAANVKMPTGTSALVAAGQVRLGPHQVRKAAGS